MSDSTPLPEARKTCNKCKVSKPFSAFGKDRAKKDGLATICLECRREYDKIRWQSPERIQWRETYEQEHRERLNQRQRDWQSKHREHTRQWQRERYAQNPKANEVAKASSKRWRVAHPQERSNQHHRRKARQKGAVHDLSAAERHAAFDYFGGCCAVCGANEGLWSSIVLDHWMPLAKGGEHSALNVIPLCHTAKGAPAGTPCCNNSKHDKLPEIWLIEQFGEKKAKRILKRVNAYFVWVQSQKG